MQLRDERKEIEKSSNECNDENNKIAADSTYKPIVNNQRHRFCYKFKLQREQFLEITINFEANFQYTAHELLNILWCKCILCWTKCLQLVTV